ncbi:MAG: HAD family hydrolase [Dehalococcoidia bacterium]
MPEARYRAVIFDMDGVLADSEPAHFEATNNVLGRYGKSLTREQQKLQMGLGHAAGIEATIRDSGVELTPEQLADEYDTELLAVLSRGSTPLPGAVSLVVRLREMGIPVALASSSLPAWIEATVAGIGLTGRFDAVVSGETVPHPKPAPDIYLRAAELIGVPAAECIAIEDSPAGLTAVKAAGMLAVQVCSSSDAFPPQPEAAIVLDSLEDFDMALLASE